MSFLTARLCLLLTGILPMIDVDSLEDDDSDLEERKLRALHGRETKEDDISKGFDCWSADFPSRGKPKVILAVEVKHTTQNGVGKVGRLKRKQK
jgi:hypothetical protein